MHAYQNSVESSNHSENGNRLDIGILLRLFENGHSNGRAVADWDGIR